MKKLVLVLTVLLVVGLIAGCSTDGGNNQPTQQQYGGGGCGVGAPAQGNSGSDAVSAVDNSVSNL